MEPDKPETGATIERAQESLGSRIVIQTRNLLFPWQRASIHMATFPGLTSVQVRQALRLREQIRTLQQQLIAILGGKGSTPGSKPKKKVGRPAGKRTISPEGRARIAEAQRRRWAKARSSAAKSAKAGKGSVKAKRKGVAGKG